MRADDDARELGRQPLERVDVLAEERGGVGALAAVVGSNSSRNCIAGFDQSTLLVFRSLNSILAVTISA